LAQWLRPPLLDRVEGTRRDLPTENRSLDMDRLGPGLAALAGDINPGRLRAAAVAAARELNIELPADTLLALFHSDDVNSEVRIEALNSLALKADRETLIKTLHQGMQSRSVGLRIRSLEWMSERFPRQALKRIAQVLQLEDSTEIKQIAIARLAKLPNDTGVSLLRELGQRLIDQSLDSRLTLDVYEALLQIPHLRTEFNLPSAKFAYSRDGGDPTRGKQLFNTHVQAQCSRCHKIGKEGSEIGPELTKIASARDADYLLRSIVQPSADIDEKYRSQVLLLSSGQMVKGAIQSQNEQQTVVADSSGQLITIETDDIDDVSVQTISLMPDMTEVLSAQEVRDLVAYLRTLK
jgi:quinoprotein glucose dehydrogenase